MLLFSRLVESAGHASAFIQRDYFTMLVAEKRDMSIILYVRDKLDNDNAVRCDIPTDVPVFGVKSGLLTVLLIGVWHRKAVEMKRHFDAFLRIVIRRRMRIMHYAVSIEIQVRVVVTHAFCFVPANKGVRLLLLFEVAGKTGVFCDSETLVSIGQGTDATHPRCQYLALNVCKGTCRNRNGMMMVFVKVDQVDVLAHRVAPFFLVWTYRQERIKKQRRSLEK